MYFFLRRSGKAFLFLFLDCSFLIFSSAFSFTFVPQNPPDFIFFLQSLLVSLPLFFIIMNHSTFYATRSFHISSPLVELFLFALPFILNFGENIDDYPLNMLAT